MPVSHKKRHSGFTLIELVAGLVVFSVVMLIVINLVASQSRRSIDPIWQVRAAELGSSLTNEIMSKAFDENSNLSGGGERCNEGTPCTTSGSLGPDADEVAPAGGRADYDDIDDYHGLNQSDGNILSSLGTAMLVDGRPLYQGYSARVSVFYDDNLDGIADAGIGNTKLVVITVTTPDNLEITFSRYRWNF